MKPINTNEMRKSYAEYRKSKCNHDFWSVFCDKSEKLANEISRVEGRASARTIAPDNIMEALETVEKELGITKKALDGCKISVDYNAQDFPNAYKYTPVSTHFDAEFRSGSWRITDISREKTRRLKERYHVTLTEEAKREIMQRYERFF